MSLGQPYTTGTVNVANNSTAVHGVGTLWLDIVEGDFFECDGLVASIASVTDTDDLVLSLPWAGATHAGATYKIHRMSYQRYDPALTQSKTRELLSTFGNLTQYLGSDGSLSGIPSLYMLKGQSELRVNMSTYQVTDSLIGVAQYQAFGSNASPVIVPQGINFGAGIPRATGSPNTFVSIFSAGATDGSQDRVDTFVLPYSWQAVVKAGKGGFFQNDIRVTAQGTWVPGVTSGFTGVLGLQVSGISSRGGTIFGLNPYAQSSAVKSVAAVGMEVDVDVDSAGTGQKVGVQSVTIGTGIASGPGTVIDAAYLIGAHSGSSWLHGFYIAPGNAVFPIRSTGAIMYASGGTVARGLDFSGMTFTQYAFIMPGAYINAAGNASFTGVSVPAVQGYSGTTASPTWFELGRVVPEVKLSASTANAFGFGEAAGDFVAYAVNSTFIGSLTAGKGVTVWTDGSAGFNVYDNRSLTAGIGGVINLQAINGSAARATYAAINAYAQSGIAGAEYGDLVFKVRAAGALVEAGRFGSDGSFRVGGPWSDGMLSVNRNTVAPGGSNNGAASSVAQFSGADGQSCDITINAYGGSPVITFRSAVGTAAARSYPILATQLMNLRGAGWVTSASAFIVQARILAVAEEAWSATARGTKLTFATSAPGTTTLSDKLMIWGSGGISISAGTHADPALSARYFDINGTVTANLFYEVRDASRTSNGFFGIYSQIMGSGPNSPCSWSQTGTYIIRSGGTTEVGQGLEANNLYLYGNASGSKTSWVRLADHSGSLLGITIGLSSAVIMSLNPVGASYFSYSACSLAIGTSATGGWSGLAKFSSENTAGGGYAVSAYASAASSIAFTGRVDAATSWFAAWFYSTSLIGSITTTGTAVAYNTTSDANLKEDQKLFDRSGAILDGLRVYDFRWKSTQQRDVGLFAQEAFKVWKNPIRAAANDNEVWQADYSKYVPVLIAEVQSLRRRVAELESAGLKAAA